MKDEKHHNTGEDRNKAIGVFDSGMGGISVLATITDLMSSERYIYFGDSYHAPYGIKPVKEITQLSIKACDFLIEKNVKAIVVACNTATSAAIKTLRAKYSIPIIGMEPAVKPAVNYSEDKSIVVLATPMTLKKEKFNTLLDKLHINDKIIKVPAPELVGIVESGDIIGTAVKKQIEYYFKEIELKRVGAVVLGCTHFIFLKEVIHDVIGQGIPIIDGNLGTAKHLRNVLRERDLYSQCSIKDPEIHFFNSMKDNDMLKKSRYLYELLAQDKNSTI